MVPQVHGQAGAVQRHAPYIGRRGPLFGVQIPQRQFFHQQQVFFLLRLLPVPVQLVQHFAVIIGLLRRGDQPGSRAARQRGVQQGGGLVPQICQHAPAQHRQKQAHAQPRQAEAVGPARRQLSVLFPVHHIQPPAHHHQAHHGRQQHGRRRKAALPVVPPARQRHALGRHVQAPEQGAELLLPPVAQEQKQRPEPHAQHHAVQLHGVGQVPVAGYQRDHQAGEHAHRQGDFDDPVKPLHRPELQGDGQIPEQGPQQEQRQRHQMEGIGFHIILNKGEDRLPPAGDGGAARGEQPTKVFRYPRQPDPPGQPHQKEDGEQNHSRRKGQQCFQPAAVFPVGDAETDHHEKAGHRQKEQRVTHHRPAAQQAAQQGKRHRAPPGHGAIQRKDAAPRRRHQQQRRALGRHRPQGRGRHDPDQQRREKGRGEVVGKGVQAVPAPQGEKERENEMQPPEEEQHPIERPHCLPVQAQRLHEQHGKALVRIPAVQKRPVPLQKAPRRR